MFGKSDDVEQEMQKVENEAISSIIDKSMTVRGEISFKGKARIDGVITGNIEGEHLILSETGKVIGDVSVSSLNCYGSLEGNVTANILTARKDCSIHGKLIAESLTVEPGASIEGEIKAASKEAKTVQTKGATAKPITSGSKK
ncbi:MAG: polymer-forming cytoskeletal protein [Desulfobulbaceae bacterium]|nr:polymer-forming cytoskeletal protein [Desulfobulbaceae bacterium]